MNPRFDSELGKFLRDKRKKLGLTISKVACRSGISLSYLGRLETGDVLSSGGQGPSSEVLEKLATALSCSVSQLIGLRELDKANRKEAFLIPSSRESSRQ